MNTVTDNVQRNMDTINVTLGNLQNIMLRAMGASEQTMTNANLMSHQTTTQVDLNNGTQPVLLEGLGTL